MVAIRYCDRCGHRLPTGADEDKAQACPQCGYLSPPPGIPAEEHRTPMPARSSVSRTPLPRARQSGRRQSSASPNALVVGFGAVAGGLVAVAVVVLVLGRGGPSEGPATARVGSGPIAPSPASGRPASLPGSVPERREPSGPATQTAAESEAFAAPGLGEDFFARLRAESESRRAAMSRRLRPIGERMKEAVQAWDSAWTVRDCRNDQDLPVENPLAHLGRSPVLATHPASRETPCALERSVSLPAGRPSALTVTVTTKNADQAEDWELRVLVDGQMIGRQVVARIDGAPRWQAFRFDLSGFAGRTVKLRLENAAGGGNLWNNEFGYWAEARVVTE